MALKRPFPTLDTFSMSSMTAVIFLLLIFFMVTSTIIFPAAIDVNLPQSSEQTSLKPVTEVYIDADSKLYLVADRNDSTEQLSRPRPVTREELAPALEEIQRQDSLRAIALYADSTITYARVIEVLDIAARHKLKMVLATRAMQTPTMADGAADTPNGNREERR